MRNDSIFIRDIETQGRYPNLSLIVTYVDNTSNQYTESFAMCFNGTKHFEDHDHLFLNVQLERFGDKHCLPE